MSLGAALALALVAPGDLEARWAGALEAAAFEKVGLSRLHAAHYQYETLGLGGTVLRIGPHGFTSPPAPWSPTTVGHLTHLPHLAFHYWWDEDAHRQTPFDLVGGYGASREPGRITSFAHRLSVTDGLLRIELGLALPRADGAPGEARLDSVREMLVTPEGVLVVRVRDAGEGAAPFALQVATHAHEGWSAETLERDGGHVELARKERACVAALGLVEREGTWFVAPASSYEGGDAAELAWARADAAREEGWESLRERSARWWRGYWSASALDLPDEELLRWWIRSLYYHAAWFGESDVPPGCFGVNPIGFSGAVCPEYDLTFSQMALLYAGHLPEARRIAGWVERTLPRARRNATEGLTLHGTSVRYARGAKYGSLAGWDGTVLVPPTEGEGVQALANYPSANAARIALAWADWSGDPESAGPALEVLREATRMVAEDQVFRPDVEGGRWLDKRAPHTLQQVAALYLLREALARGIGEPGWAEMADGILIPTADLAGRRVIPAGPGATAYEGYGDAPWLSGLWWYGCQSAGDPLVRDTYEMLRRSGTGGYVFNRGWLGVYAAKMGDAPEALRRARSLLEEDVCLFDDTCIGEIVWDWEDFKKTPETAAHAALVCNIAQMLLDPDDDRELSVFPAVPEEWLPRGVAFRDLAARGGLAVSGALSADAVTVSLRNRGRTDVTRTLRVRLPEGIRRITESPHGAAIEGEWLLVPEVTLAPGAEVRIRVER